jgi:LmbE family N-acetylglucosaminyl deacetylase
MNLNLKTAEIYVPDGVAVNEALARTTHLGIGAHPDDLEIIAWPGIGECYERDDAWFTGIVVTHGGGSPRTGPYAGYDDERMRTVRREEQKKAADLGRYAAVVMLDYASADVKDVSNASPVDDIRAVLEIAQPRIVYTHTLADKHDTHVAVALRTIAAIRGFPAGSRPRQVLGCEAWRDLDWLTDADKVALDCSAHEDLQHSLLGVYDSQIAGGKRYDLAVMGRRRAHATYHESHQADAASGLIFAMDFTPLIADPSRDIGDFTHEFVKRFSDEISDRIRRLQ